MKLIICIAMLCLFCISLAFCRTADNQDDTHSSAAKKLSSETHNENEFISADESPKSVLNIVRRQVSRKVWRKHRIHKDRTQAKVSQTNYSEKKKPEGAASGAGRRWPSTEDLKTMDTKGSNGDNDINKPADNNIQQFIPMQQYNSRLAWGQSELDTYSTLATSAQSMVDLYLSVSTAYCLSNPCGPKEMTELQSLKQMNQAEIGFVDENNAYYDQHLQRYYRSHSTQLSATIFTCFVATLIHFM